MTLQQLQRIGTIVLNKVFLCGKIRTTGGAMPKIREE